MTLIISVITPDYVMQASDRRVSSITPAGNFIDAVDETNKAIFVAERMTFAFTGHAQIAGTDTAEFFQMRVASALAGGADVETALQGVAGMCNQYLRTLPSEIDRHHAIVGVGWTAEERMASRTPFIYLLSNSLDEYGDWKADPDDEFSTRRVGLSAGDPCAVNVAGVRLDEAARLLLCAQLAAHTASSSDPEPTAQLLVAAIQSEADRSEKSLVGRGVMVNTLPISPGGPGPDIHLIAGPPRLDSRTFSYVSPRGYQDILLGPLIVGSSGEQLGPSRAEGGGLIGPNGGTTGILYRPATAPPPRLGAIGQRIRESKIGRNDPCWCGSERKFKKCHGP